MDTKNNPHYKLGRIEVIAEYLIRDINQNNLLSKEELLEQLNKIIEISKIKEEE
jgi:hypothetical protein